MTSARKIMKRKAFIRAFMEKRMPKAQSDAVWRDAENRLEAILRRYPDIPKGVRAHTDPYIFPFAAIYQAASEVIGAPAAYQVLEDACIEYSTKAGRALAKLMRLPGMPALFIRLWDPLARRMFGPANGFQNVFYPKTRGAYRMDVTACPYCRYFAELGCPELTKMFCANDDRVYGNLPGIEFRRKGTLGRGDDRCDFYARRVKP